MLATMHAIRSTHQPDPSSNAISDQIVEVNTNKTSHLDSLPQPLRFIRECFDDLVLGSLYDRITEIEEIRKTPEYEGNIKVAMATGSMDINGITTTHTIQTVLKSGGLSEKPSEAPGGRNSTYSRLILGDKFGSIHLVDSQRKLVTSKKELEFYKGRRITSISSAALEWVDTRLVYLAVTARASPIVTILVFKVNENKLYELYRINLCPEMENPKHLEKNEG
jgi:hypothetical protein